MDKLVELGEKLKLSGKDLTEFIREQQKIAREERANERAVRREEEERLERERQNERQKLIKEQEFELRARELEHEKAMMEMKLQLSEMEGNKSSSDRPGYMGIPKMTVPAPRMPPFSAAEDLDAYLLRFERFARAQAWSHEDYATNLSLCLSGEALEVYSRLSPEDSLDYDKLKEALLQRFQLTEEGFRRKFRRGKPKEGETTVQFLARIENYLKRWINLAKIENTFEGVCDLLLREQLLNTSSKELVIFVKEHSCETAEELARLSDRYLEAHGGRKRADFSKRFSPVGENQQQTNIKPGADKDGSSREQNKNTFKCFLCGKSNHKAKDCWSKGNNSRVHKAQALQQTESKADSETLQGQEASACMVKLIKASSDKQIELAGGEKIPVVSAACQDTGEGKRENLFLTERMPVKEGKVNGQSVSVLRDSGCSGIVIRRSLVRDEQLTGLQQLCVLIDGTVRRVDEAEVEVQTPFFSGKVKAMCMQKPIYDLIIGNIPGVRGTEVIGNNKEGAKPHKEKERQGDVSKNYSGENQKDKLDLDEKEPQSADQTEEVGAVQTRAQVAAEHQRKGRPLKTPEIKVKDVSPEQFRRDQREDGSLEKLFEKVELEKDIERKGDGYFVRDGILYKANKLGQEEDSCVVVPTIHREAIMQIAHDSIMGGHLGYKKTLDKIRAQFTWPGITADVERYCKSCDACQRTIPKGKVVKAPLGSMPIIETPFHRVAVDLVGPIVPKSDKGNRYILTLVDYATRFPEAVALKTTDTEKVAEALVDMFARVGIPNEVLSDNGPQFISDVMKEVGRLLSLRQLKSTPYHPMCNGLVEKFNGTLKLMLRRMAEERPKDWDRYISSLLFAYREAPQASTGFSPFELLYGRSVRGPLSILREIWTNEETEAETKTTYQYVLDLKERLETTCKLAHEELRKSGERYRKYYDKGSKESKLKVGDKALILLPTDNNKLLMHWKGPYVVTHKQSDKDFTLDINGKTKTFHANMLKKYVEREIKADEVKIGASLMVEQPKMQTEDNSELLTFPTDESDEKATIASTLNKEERERIHEVLQTYEHVVRDAPGQTSITECTIKLTSDDPVRTKAYPIPHALRETLNKEVEKMLEADVIEKSSSPYSSPVVLVKKPDGTIRFCVDYRKLNRITVFDAEPMPSAEDIYAKLSGDKYFSKIDLRKGYWQIKMDAASKDKTAFATPDGLYNFKTMPFGLVCAPAVFSRLMRTLLRGLKGVDNYIDDILIHTESFDDHVRCLEEVLQRLSEANMTAKPSKCFFGYETIEFLGHNVGNGSITPITRTLEKIEEAERPKTKKQVRSFLGLTGYYRDFIQNYSTIATPLSELTKKAKPNKVIWEEKHENSYNQLKSALSKAPVLRLPDLDREFVLQTDASDVGIGAVLMQRYDGTLFPVSYASRKLLPRERNYSVVERECLALVWAVQKFHVLVYGKEFTLQTDHASLAHINKAKLTNSRILRWSLILQEYRFKVEAIKGTLNVCADYLSRLD